MSDEITDAEVETVARAIAEASGPLVEVDNPEVWKIMQRTARIHMAAQRAAREFCIARLELAPGDILVVKSAKLPNWAALQAMVPSGVRVCHIPPEMDFFVLSRAEIEERAK